MGEQLDSHGTMGFKIEKDKCAMFEFFQNNAIDLPELLSDIKRDKQAIVSQLRAMKALYASGKPLQFPMFLKGCHLTQGSDKGMMPLKEAHFRCFSVIPRRLLTTFY